MFTSLKKLAILAVLVTMSIQAQDDNCLIIQSAEVICATDGSGGVTLTFDLINQEDYDAHYVVIEAPSGVIFANQSATEVLDLNQDPYQPLVKGERRTFEIDVAQVDFDVELCITISIHDQTRQECCSRQVCFDIPACDCLQVTNSQVDCNDDGSWQVELEITNLSPNTAYTAWITGPPGVKLEPYSGFISLPSPLAPWDSTILTLTMSGAEPGDLCLLVSIHGENLSLCCSVQDVCIIVPDCRACVLVPGDCVARIPYLAQRLDAENGPVAVSSCYVELEEDHVLGMTDLRGQPTSGLWNPPMYHNEMPNPTNCEADVWNRKNLGTIFGLTLDRWGNIYATASSSYLTNHFPQGSGAIYRINGNTGKIDLFTTLDQGKGQASLGNISYGRPGGTDVLYVTNFATGKIHALDLNGNPIDTPFDPLGSNNDADCDGWADLGQRLWGVEYHNNRVYFGVWNHNTFQSSPDRQQIFSVAVGADGKFVGSERWELDLPEIVPGSGWSSPVSDLSFTPEGQMLIAERSMGSKSRPGAHQSRVTQWVCEGGQWLQVFEYQLGSISPPYILNGAAGGVDVIYPPTSEEHLVWATSEWMNRQYYGLQGMAYFESFADSLYVDAGVRKYWMGDVEIPCLPAEPPIFSLTKIGWDDPAFPDSATRGFSLNIPVNITNASPQEAPGILFDWNLRYEINNQIISEGRLITTLLTANTTQTYEIVVDIPEDAPLGLVELVLRANSEVSDEVMFLGSDTISRTIFINQ